MWSCTVRHRFPEARIAGLDDPDRGLSAAAAAERLTRYGPNAISEERPPAWLALACSLAGDPMLWFLLVAAALFAWLGELIEAAVLAAALIPIMAMDAYLERRTSAATAGLSGRLAPIATVVRDGVPQPVPARTLVPGDLVEIGAGQIVPADGVVVAGEGLQMDEAALTGESAPVRKHPISRVCRGAIDEDGWAAAGTRLLTGTARVRVVYTGAETVYGGIVRSAAGGERQRTPLQAAIAALVMAMLVATVVICFALAVIRWYQGAGLADALLSAATLAVAALPEEYPVVFSFFLGVGVFRLARRQALVRRAVVVENIGRVSCICSDKTGTLTAGRLRLAHVLTADCGEEELRAVAALASRTETGDPLDEAILSEWVEREPRPAAVATFPFTEERAREAAVLRADGSWLVVVKGAPERVLAMCDLGQPEHVRWLAATAEFAAGGHKVIGCAQRRLDEWTGGEPDRGYRFAGLLAFEDPVRPGVADSIAAARAAGIRVLMLTGDHAATAASVAREVGIGGGQPRIVEGAAMEQCLARGGEAPDVIARALPAHKLALVRALQARGEIVAVTGDGINDVPALQGADIGIAMGERGSASAREAAAVVLLDDDFSTIVRAIAEGQQLFRNLQLSFAYLLMVHLPLVATAALIPLAGFPPLYLPIHVVWLELIIHPTALLVFQEVPASGRLAPVRKGARLHVFTPGDWWLIGVVGLLVTVLIGIGYARSLGADADVEHARSMALVALVCASATVTAGLSRLRSATAIAMVIATLISALVLVQPAPVAAALHLSPLHVDDWAMAGTGGLLAGLLATWWRGLR